MCGKKKASSFARNIFWEMMNWKYWDKLLPYFEHCYVKEYFWFLNEELCLCQIYESSQKKKLLFYGSLSSKKWFLETGMRACWRCTLYKITELETRTVDRNKRSQHNSDVKSNY